MVPLLGLPSDVKRAISTIAARIPESLRLRNGIPRSSAISVRAPPVLAVPRVRALGVQFSHTPRRVMVPSISSPDIEAYRLMRAGRFPEALAFAQRAVAGKRVCLTAHGMLASILIRLRRTPEAATGISPAAELETGGAGAYDGLGYVSPALGGPERAHPVFRRATEISPQSPR